MQRVLVIGATSAIAEAVSRLYAGRGARLYLVGRDLDRIERIAADLRVRSASAVDCGRLDVNDFGEHEVLMTRAWATMGGVDLVLVAHGTLPDQAACDASMERLLAEFATNGTATIALAAASAARLQPGATLAVISSVAGDRGRASNYVYGAAKAAVNAYLSGLRQRLHRDGIHVLTIKPGFVDTPMTSGFRKGILWASPATVARGIVRAIDKRRAVAYVPWFWWGIMQVITHIPERIFRRILL